MASGHGLALPKRTASTASNRSLISGDAANLLLEGGKSQSSKRAGGATHLQSHPDQRQSSSTNANMLPQASAGPAGQYAAAELASGAANGSQSKGNQGTRNGGQANQHRNSKNRKLYTSIGAYNNRGEEYTSKQGFMATGGAPGGMPGGVVGLGAAGHGGVMTQGQQALAQGSLQAALARKMQHAQVH